MRQIIFTLFLFSFAGGYGQKLLNQSDIEEKSLAWRVSLASMRISLP